MKNYVLKELKIYFDEINSKTKQDLRKYMLRLGLRGIAQHTYSKKKENPLLECSEYYLDDINFIKKAIEIDVSSIKFASKRLRQDKTIAKLVLKKDKKLANRFIFKKTLKEIS